MIVASEIELRAGARLLLESASFQVSAGDRIGLVGRNGAGKTTLAKVLAGEAQPAAGSVRRSGTVGYLPQDPRTGNLDMLAIDRVLSARGLDQLRAELRAAEAAMAASDSGTAAAAIRKYGRLEERLAVLGGYAAESQAASLTASLGLPDRVLQQPLHTLSGGQRRRVELARILFSDSATMLLDEPTNHLDADSVAWLRDHLKSYRGALVVISHDVALLADVVNKVFYLDAQRACLDPYNLGWRAYLQQRETDERRRRRERVNAGRQAGALMAQADQGPRRAEHAAPGRADAGRRRGRAHRRPGGQAPLPGTRAVRPHPADRGGPVQVVRLGRGVHRGRRRRRPGQPGGDPRAQRSGQDDAAPAAGRAGGPGHRKSRARPWP
jgi:ATPase subunit of ABC transporter with duplicated ATPase domains